ncbi:MAG: endoflagellar motor switch protein [Leptospira sp.]|nr:endoflagellar motor switch protein [Leptospira sp.]
MKGSTKATSIYKLLGEDLPMEVFDHLTQEEIEKFILKLSNKTSLSKSQEAGLLKEFVDSLRKKPVFASKQTKPSFAPTQAQAVSRQETVDDYLASTSIEEEFILAEIEKLLEEQSSIQDNTDLEILENLPASRISQIIVDEPASIIAQILFFTPNKTAQIVISDLPKKLKEDVIIAMGELDFHSQELRDELSRFLSFKMSLSQSKNNSAFQKIRGRKGKKAAEILNVMNPGESREILSKIQKKRPQFAENIIEHYYSFRDLLLLGRKSLSDFLGGFHPIVVATALKGIEILLKEEILNSIEPWIAKEIRLECDSLGSVSLAEIEESHLGILDRLREELEEGRLKLWRWR